MRAHPIWLPCTQMKDYEDFPLAQVVRAEGAYLYLNDGRTLIDAISSWWCKSLGHQHPRLKKALMQQFDRFEHVILAGTTNDTIEALSHKLIQLTPTLNKIFYASDGSSAVEIAFKMSLHSRQLTGQTKRHQFLTLQNSYHGETIGALSVSDVGMYQAPYQQLMFKTPVIVDLPYVQGTTDPLWSDCSAHWQRIEAQLAPYAGVTTAILVEPILQCAGGMKIYSQDFLKRLRAWTLQHDIHLIADEIATGIGRTGKMLACDHANITPDFLCLGKGLTAGVLPLSAMLTSQRMYDLFYDDYQTGKSFLHSHTHSGNALAAAVALEVMTIMEEESMCEKANELGRFMYQEMHDIAESTGELSNVRQLGAMVAADLTHAAPHDRAGFAIYKKAMHMGALLRPLGNTLYWLPPLNTTRDVLAELKTITARAITEIRCHKKN